MHLTKGPNKRPRLEDGFQALSQDAYQYDDAAGFGGAYDFGTMRECPLGLIRELLHMSPHRSRL